MVIRLQIPESPRYTMDVLLNSKQALRDTERYFFVPKEMPIAQDANDDDAENDTSQTEAYTLDPQHIDGGNGQEHSRDPRVERDSADSSPVQRPQISRRSNRTHYMNSTPHAVPPVQVMATDQQSPQPPFTSREWWSDFKQYIATDRNWIPLAGTMTTWFLLDVSSTAFLLLSYQSMHITTNGRIGIFLWTRNELPQSDPETLGWSE